MKYTNFAWALAFIGLATGCKDDNVAGIEPANPGDNVQFSASLSEKSRTIYDGETSTGLKISWVKGDKIAVASPQCADGGRTNGLYEVNIGSADKQNYANSLDMVGENGVQWGKATEGYNFYAVYPVTSASDITVSGSTVTAKGSVPTDQVCFLPNSYTPPTSPAGTASFPLNPDNRTMEGQFMYAQTPSQNSGSTVNLRFTPASTVLYMTFAGYTHTGNLPEGQADELMIRSITLTAPEGTNIAGDFDVTFSADAQSAPTFTASAGADAVASNSVTVHTVYQTAEGTDGRYLTIKEGQNFSIKMIINPMLAANLTINSDWTISVNTAAGTFSKALAPSEGANTTLVAGQVHKMNFPVFTIAGDELWQFAPASWMAQLPRNVYVTELSLPGAWYAWDGSDDENEGYQQSTASINNLFASGIRAFQVETRVGFTGRAGSSNISNGTVVISGTGDNGILGAARYYQNATALNNMINDIQTAMNLTTSQNEYVVLAITYSDGGSKSLGEDCKSIWINKLQSILSSYNNIVYASDITPSTTIGEVEGKIIVLICVDSSVENNVTTWPNALFGYTDMSWDPSSLNTSLISPMEWKAWPFGANEEFGSNVAIESVGQNPDNLYLNYTLANRTYNSNGASLVNSLPTLAIRQNAIETIISNSDQVYAAKTHNAWYFIGAGGTTAQNTSGDSDTNGPMNVASSLNSYLLTQIQSKITNNKPSPLGLVFINQATNATYSGPALIREIFEMNNQFYLNRAETTSGGNNPNPSPIRSLSENHSSGFTTDSETWQVF